MNHTKPPSGLAEARPRQTDPDPHTSQRQRRDRQRQPVPSQVIEAARENFLRFGVNRTTMADIARVLGMPRQTLYEFVASRDELVDAVLVQRIREIADDIQAPTTGSITDAFVEISLNAVRHARRDDELMNIVATGPTDRVQAVVAGPHPEIHSIVRDLLEPIFSLAKAEARLQAGRSPDTLIDWVRIVYLSLITQPGIDPDHERDLVESFLLPSVIRPAEPSSSGRTQPIH